MRVRGDSVPPQTEKLLLHRDEPPVFGLGQLLRHTGVHIGCICVHALLRIAFTKHCVRLSNAVGRRKEAVDTYLNSVDPAYIHVTVGNYKRFKRLLVAGRPTWVTAIKHEHDEA